MSEPFFHNNEWWPDPDAVVPECTIIEGSSYATGVAGTTPVFCCGLSDKERAMDLKPGDTLRPKFEVRMGIALFGSNNLDDREMKAIGYNPFHPQFYDNYVKGSGNTVEEAIGAMVEDQKQMADTLWAI